MELKDLEDKKQVDILQAKIVSFLDEETIASGAKVQRAIIEDSSGQAILKIWNEQIGEFSEGDEIVIQKGYSYLFKDEMVVSSGKFGTLKKL